MRVNVVGELIPKLNADGDVDVDVEVIFSIKH